MRTSSAILVASLECRKMEVLLVLDLHPDAQNKSAGLAHFAWSSDAEIQDGQSREQWYQV